MNDYKSRRRKYKLHKLHAKQREIPWLLNYTTWIKIWLSSQHWHERGKERGQYQMARFGDKGPYATWNVRICTIRENQNEAHLGRKYSKETRIKMSKSRIGNKNRLGTKHSQETRHKISIAKKGAKPTIESRHKMSIAQKARWKRTRTSNASTY